MLVNLIEPAASCLSVNATWALSGVGHIVQLWETSSIMMENEII